MDGDPSPAAAAAARPLVANFRAVQVIYNEVNNSQLSTNDAGLQQRVMEGLARCEVALLQVERLAVFSPNELGEDINTGDLKYLLLPFFRGELLLRVVNQPKRVQSLGEALRCLHGFVADQERLELLAPEARGWKEMGASASNDPAAVRDQKIARYKASKAAKQRMELLGEKLAKAGKRAGDEEAGDDDDEDVDELEREQLTLLLHSCVFTAIDSIRAAEQELDMLERIEKMRGPDGSLPPAPTVIEEDPSMGLQMLSLLPDGGSGQLQSTSAGPLGLRIVDPTRDSSSRLSYATAMRQIHTGEIPGLFTFSVEEGLRQEEAERAMEEAARMQQMSERAEARREAKAMREEGDDEEDEEERQKLIKQDEYREMHKRGAGNRQNRS